MSKGLRISTNSSDEELEFLKGAKAIQVTVPSQKYFGFEIHNFNGTISEISKIDNGKLEIKIDGVEDALVCYSAVITYELVGLAAIIDFGKD